MPVTNDVKERDRCGAFPSSNEVRPLGVSFKMSFLLPIDLLDCP